MGAGHGVGLEGGHAAVVEALGRLGADVNRADDDGWTPLGIARDEGHSEAAAALERLGAAISDASESELSQ